MSPFFAANRRYFIPRLSNCDWPSKTPTQIKVKNKIKNKKRHSLAPISMHPVLYHRSKAKLLENAFFKTIYWIPVLRWLQSMQFYTRCCSASSRIQYNAVITIITNQNTYFCRTWHETWSFHSRGQLKSETGCGSTDVDHRSGEQWETTTWAARSPSSYYRCLPSHSLHLMIFYSLGGISVYRW